MAAITIGPGAIDRPDSAGVAGATRLMVSSPATGTGNIDTLKVYMTTGPTANCKMGTFYNTTGTRYTCRGFVSLGALAAGLNTFTGLTLPVQAGDVLGIYSTTDKDIDVTNSGGTMRYRAVDGMSVGSDNDYDGSIGWNYSIEGSGQTPPPAAGGGGAPVEAIMAGLL